MTGRNILVGFLVAGLIVGLAAWIHGGWKPETYVAYGTRCWKNPPPPAATQYYWCAYDGHRAYAWQDPLAVVVAFAGLGAGAAIISRQPVGV